MICPNCGKEGDISLFRPSRGKGAIDRPRQCLDCYQEKRKEIYAKYDKGRNAERRARWRNDPEYRRKNKEACERYREDNKDELKRRWKKRWSEKRRKLIEFYGGQCECCEESHIEFLCIDHIAGGGARERKRLGTTAYYRKLFQSMAKGVKLDGYRVLCHNCNMALGFYGYCPHRTRVGNRFGSQTIR